MVNYIRSLATIPNASTEILVATNNDLANIKINSFIVLNTPAKVGSSTRFKYDPTSVALAGPQVIVPNDGTTPGRWLLDPGSSDFGSQTVIAGGLNLNGDILLIGQADTVHIQVRGFSSQTVDQTQWQTSAGVVQASVSANGSFTANKNSTQSFLGLVPSTPNTSGLFLGGVTPSAANYSVLGTTTGNLTINTPGVSGTLSLKSQGQNPAITVNGTGLGFFNATPIAKPTITGAGFFALNSLISALNSLGLVNGSAALVASKVTVTSSPYNMLANDYVVLCNRNTTGPMSISLFASPIDGQIVNIKDIKGTSSNVGENVTINRSGSQLIDGLTTYVLNVNWNSVEMIFDAPSNNWYVI